MLKYLFGVTAVSIFAALFSVIYQAFQSLRQLNKLSHTLTSLLAIESLQNNRDIFRPKVAVGFGSCTDLVISATSFLNFSDFATEIGPNFSVDDVTNEREFLQSFAYYFQNGAAAERFTPDSEFFQKLIWTAKNLHKNEITWNLGGNAPVMGVRFFKEGADVLLAARMSHKLRKHLPNDLKLAGDLVEEDDIHLILEYKTGAKWGPYTAPRANRYILHNDKNNPKISSLELFDKQLQSFEPRLLVVSGLQMMDSYKFEPGVREARLEKVQKQISAQKSSTLVHFEMASYVEIDLLNLLSQYVIPYSDSLGMNEQELDNLQQVLRIGKVQFASDSNPRVAIALDQMREIFTIINQDYIKNKNSDKNRRPLSRIHVHTLAYQAILIVKGSQWKNTKNAAAKASLRAHRHVCGTEVINPESTYLVLDDSFASSAKAENNELKRIKLDPKNPVPCWNENLTISGHTFEYEICLAPVLVCRVAKQTAGAGDNISASGLVLQI